MQGKLGGVKDHVFLLFRARTGHRSIVRMTLQSRQNATAITWVSLFIVCDQSGQLLYWDLLSESAGVAAFREIMIRPAAAHKDRRSSTVRALDETTRTPTGNDTSTRDDICVGGGA